MDKTEVVYISDELFDFITYCDRTKIDINDINFYEPDNITIRDNSIEYKIPTDELLNVEMFITCPVFNTLIRFSINEKYGNNYCSIPKAEVVRQFISNNTGTLQELAPKEEFTLLDYGSFVRDWDDLVDEMKTTYYSFPEIDTNNWLFVYQDNVMKSYWHLYNKRSEWISPPFSSFTKRSKDTFLCHSSGSIQFQINVVNSNPVITPENSDTAEWLIDTAYTSGNILSGFTGTNYKVISPPSYNTIEDAYIDNLLTEEQFEKHLDYCNKLDNDDSNDSDESNHYGLISTFKQNIYYYTSQL